MNDAIIRAIDREREYQRKKHGFTRRSVTAWLLIIESELAEAKQAWVRSENGDDAAALREILQIAACCVAAMEQHGVHERSS